MTRWSDPKVREAFARWIELDEKIGRSHHYLKSYRNQPDAIAGSTLLVDFDEFDFNPTFTYQWSEE